MGSDAEPKLYEDSYNFLEPSNKATEVAETECLSPKSSTPKNKKMTILQNIELSCPKDGNYQANQTSPLPISANINGQRDGIVGNSKKHVDVSHRKGRVWDKKDRCIYCEKDCTNFSRHLFRNHATENSVSKIMQLPKGDKTRKDMINLIRKEGNFTLLEENKIRPVQRVTEKYENKEQKENIPEFLPCPYCKGIYRLKSLRKHSKKCSYNPHSDSKCNIASLAQNVLVFKASRTTFLNKLRLKNEVFTNMHADRASFNGKNDPVICQYGEDYLKKHKRPHIKNVVSNKIRELGRLLIPLQDIYGLNTILEALNTKYYDNVVHAAQIISGYDDRAKTFQAPSLAMHFKTILLGACLAAKTLLLKQDPILAITDYTQTLKNVKAFRTLVDERWKFDMGSLALKDLHEKHGKKPQTLPITSDVIKFRSYAVNVAETSMRALKENFSDCVAFKKLTEAALVLTIVINRKRVGDVQYIKLESYTQTTNNTNQEEVLNVLSDSEKLLSSHFKRIITLGKSSKSVPILFPKDVETYIEQLLLSRERNGLIPKENPYLFASIGTKNRWVDGSCTLRKYASSCGAANPATLTSSRLRKQIATLLQLLNLNEIEKEQMASFMGHTKKTHEEFYRLPQDVYQTAKIAKLLLLINKGESANFQGKTLEEIDIYLEEVSADMQKRPNSDIDSDNDIDKEEKISPDVDTRDIEIQMHETIKFSYESNKESTNTSREPSSKRVRRENNQEAKERYRGSWSDEQKTIMKNFFKKHINRKITPKKHECVGFKNANLNLFDEKTWVQIKVFVYNTFRNK